MNVLAFLIERDKIFQVSDETKEFAVVYPLGSTCIGSEGIFLRFRLSMRDDYFLVNFDSL
jgi:hypothetical protein